MKDTKNNNICYQILIFECSEAVALNMQEHKNKFGLTCPLEKIC